ncbi:MAG TPA: hypothetical protein DIW38_03745 [Oceanicaulis sp.]|uniref:hypothetical protein n=2 Tax=Oceanicaulis TaxID=153232 RepID=UPI000EEB64CE|nr:hypothetical protein [Oceanicaulis alexandrii]HCR65612.1 hypothetical protein [Oceanicaulis sp.]|tara:strand:- start:16 stop:264 length:249 start_codon:yes stop_codon:yes gene_type:complete
MIMTMTTELSQALCGGSDYLWGAKAIAEYLGLSERQVRYAEERGELPIGRSCGKLFASKRLLDGHLEELASGLQGYKEGGAA